MMSRYGLCTATMRMAGSAWEPLLASSCAAGCYSSANTLSMVGRALSLLSSPNVMWSTAVQAHLAHLCCGSRHTASPLL